MRIRWEKEWVLCIIFTAWASSGGKALSYRKQSTPTRESEAVTNAKMDEIWELVPERTPIEIQP